MKKYILILLFLSLSFQVTLTNAASWDEDNLWAVLSDLFWEDINSTETTTSSETNTNTETTTSMDNTMNNTTTDNNTMNSNEAVMVENNKASQMNEQNNQAVNSNNNAAPVATWDVKLSKLPETWALESIVALFSLLLAWFIFFRKRNK